MKRRFDCSRQELKMVHEIILLCSFSKLITYNGRARLKQPQSTQSTPILVLTNTKYLPIMDKKCALDRLGRSNRAWPMLHLVTYIKHVVNAKAGNNDIVLLVPYYKSKQFDMLLNLTGFAHSQIVNTLIKVKASILYHSRIINPPNLVSTTLQLIQIIGLHHIYQFLLSD